VQDLLLERVTLDLADERLGGRATERELDDGAAGGDGREQLLELTGLERERSRACPYTTAGTRPAERSLRATPLPVSVRASALRDADAMDIGPD
jgi:hypothetical protein